MGKMQENFDNSGQLTDKEREDLIDRFAAMFRVRGESPDEALESAKFWVDSQDVPSDGITTD